MTDQAVDQQGELLPDICAFFRSTTFLSIWTSNDTNRYRKLFSFDLRKTKLARLLCFGVIDIFLRPPKSSKWSLIRVVCFLIGVTCNVELDGDICFQFQTYRELLNIDIRNCSNFLSTVWKADFQKSSYKLETGRKYHHSTQHCKLSYKEPIYSDKRSFGWFWRSQEYVYYFKIKQPSEMGLV